MQGRIALVLGGESGIGRAVGTAFAKVGGVVVLAGLLVDEGAAAERELRRAGLAVAFEAVDVRASGALDVLVDEIVATHGRLDIMVYSVGVFDGLAGCAETGDALWQQIIDVNLTGCFRAIRAALRPMRRQQSGRIVAMSSIGAFRPTAAGVSYATAKAGIIAMVRQSACEVAAEGITINAVCPGIIDTAMRDHSQTLLGDLADMQRGIGASPDGYKRFVPAGRRGTAEEVAALTLYLAGDAAGYVTGQAWSIDGGWSAT